MSATLPRLGPDADAAAVTAALAAEGAVVVERLAPPALMVRAGEELAPWSAGAPLGQDDFRGYRTSRVGALAARSAAVRELLVHPLVTAVADRVLGPHCKRWQLAYTQFIRLGPGESVQALHRDDEVYFLPPPAGVEWLLILMWAQSDFTSANGGTLVVPGSHRWPRDRKPEAGEVAAAEMPAGSLLMHLGSTIHGGGANATDGERCGISVNYNLGWLRQIENQYLAVPPDLARGLDPALQDLLGYAVHGRIMGEAGLIDPRLSLLGRDAAEVAEADARAGKAADRKTLSGY